MQSRVNELGDDMSRVARDQELTIAASLDRVANALDTIAAQLATQARDHREALAAVEFVVREMALVYIRPIASSASTASNVFGGTIEPNPIDLDPLAIEALASAHTPKGGPTELQELHVGCIVEVRSRFQNRWVDGFEIVEIVQRDEGERYRLARHADHVDLPALFEACDLRPLDVVGEIVIESLTDGIDDGNTIDARDPAAPAFSSLPGDPGSRR